MFDRIHQENACGIAPKFDVLNSYAARSVVSVNRWLVGLDRLCSNLADFYRDLVSTTSIMRREISWVIKIDVGAETQEVLSS